MKIKNKNILTNIFIIGLVLGIGLFALQNLNVILMKLRFIEISDDLNASVLEMRLSEKNYLLYHKPTFLVDIREKIESTERLLQSAGPEIIRAIGNEKFLLLNADLKNYSDVVDEIQRNTSFDMSRDNRFRAAGRKLREFSSTITHLERKDVNDIIYKSKSIVIFSFTVILIGVVFMSHLISHKIRLSLREIETIAKAISQGNFSRIESALPDDEFGLVMAAINAMSYELQNREEALIQSRKLASLGILTAGVAHELINPLNNISMIAQTYAEVYDNLDKTQRIEFMAKVGNETERIKEIIKNLLDFSKPKEANLAESDINTVVQKTLKLVQNMLDISNIETKINVSQDLPHVYIDDSQIQQVLVNLVTNASQAMPMGGKLFISTRRGSSGDSVEITVMDTGKGIPAEFLLNIFDPFFSTKGEGGTGLGLSISYGIIKNHKGDIRVESKVGVGTTFTIELPTYKERQASSVEED